VELGRRGDQAQAETAAGRRAAPIQAYEALQHPGPIRLGYTGSAVPDFEARLSARERHAKAGVVDEVRKRLGEQLAIAPDSVAGSDVVFDPERFVFGERLVEVQHIACDGGEIDRLHLHPEGPGFGLGDLQQGIDGTCSRSLSASAVSSAWR
jgi:hypothetical protein